MSDFGPSDSKLNKASSASFMISATNYLSTPQHNRISLIGNALPGFGTQTPEDGIFPAFLRPLQNNEGWRSLAGAVTRPDLEEIRVVLVAIGQVDDLATLFVGRATERTHFLVIGQFVSLWHLFEREDRF